MSLDNKSLILWWWKAIPTHYSNLWRWKAIHSVLHLTHILPHTYLLTSVRHCLDEDTTEELSSWFLNIYEYLLSTFLLIENAAAEAFSLFLLVWGFPHTLNSLMWWRKNEEEKMKKKKILSKFSGIAFCFNMRWCLVIRDLKRSHILWNYYQNRRCAPWGW